MAERFKVALALGGGGVRGLAHIGIFRVFERARIPIDLIVGTSMGAIVGGAYALSRQSLDIEQKILELLKRKEIARLESLAGKTRPEDKELIVQGLLNFVKDLIVWNLKGIKRSIANGAEIKSMIKELIQDAEFEQAKISFACIACDLNSGEEVILNQGKMGEAIMASSSVAGVFAPLELSGRLLIDGATTSEIPVEAARKLGADFVIAVNVESRIYQEDLKHGMDILFQSDEIRSHELIQMKLKLADFVIHPDLKDISWAAFSKAEQCIQKGEQAADSVLTQLKSAIGRKKRSQLFKKLFGILPS